MTSETLPFAPRALMRSERRREDVYLYTSPKAARRVALIGPLALAQALLFEFMRSCLAFVERPRRLCVNDGHIELSFWTRHERGLERFWLLVPADDTRGPGSLRRTHRESAAIIAAAQAAQLSLEFIFEEDVRKQAALVSTWFRTLPYVQTAAALPSRFSLREHVLEVFNNVEQATFEQIEGTLRAFHAVDVRAIVCDLIHAGSLMLVDPTHINRFSVVRRTEVVHAPAR